MEKPRTQRRKKTIWTKMTIWTKPRGLKWQFTLNSTKNRIRKDGNFNYRCKVMAGPDVSIGCLHISVSIGCLHFVPRLHNRGMPLMKTFMIICLNTHQLCLNPSSSTPQILT
ncbi:hypothetical protein HanIR_Chr14g0716161 [Helianthus annuus]|nr:hypothetical protein HanIR_Chr14g0716161 [Helianthus annuus]